MGNQIFVTNMNGVDPKGVIDPKVAFTHEDRYDGEDFVFPPGERVLISAEAATHMFGRNLVDKTDTLLRLGWANKYDPKSKNMVEDKDGVKRLAAFVFEEAVMVAKSSPLARALEKSAAA
jgi:hypothetical protein